MSDVLFPIVGCNGAHIATVRCDCLNARDYPAGRALVLARDEQEIERILADARSGETTGAEIARPIWVRFMPQQFTGRSYGLALALADKRARYHSATKLVGRRLFATGIITEDGAGRIGKVQSFEEKLLAIIEEARAGDVAVFPKENVVALSPSQKELLDRLDRKAVSWRSAENLSELVDLYASPSDKELLAQRDMSGDRNARRNAHSTPTSERASIGADDSTSTAVPSDQVERRFRPNRFRPAATIAVISLAGMAAFVVGHWFGASYHGQSYAGENSATAETTSGNLLANPSFERGEGQQPVGWITYSRGKHDHADYVRSGGIDGSLMLEHGSDKAFYVDTHQILSVPEGYYAFSAWISSEGKRKAHRMRARGDEPVEIDIPMTAPDQFQELSIHCIKVTEGRLAVGFYMDAFKESSAAYDKVAVIGNPRTADGRDCADQSSAADDISTNAFDGKNFVENPSFELSHDQKPIGWGTFSRDRHDDADSVKPGGINGSFALEHGGDGAFYVDTYQVLWVANGYYAMSAWANTDGVEKVNRMYARGDDVIELDIPKAMADGYRQFQIHCIKATEQKIVVGFYTDTHQASVTAYDNVQLVRHDQTADGTRCAES
jgi:hypothetical protein